MNKEIRIKVSIVVAMLIAQFGVVSTAMAQGGTDSPYAMFGDNSAMLEARQESPNNIYSVQFQANNGVTYLADFDLNKGIATLRDLNDNIILQDSISENAKAMFTTMDPDAEKFYNTSPYAYCMGNPVNAIDPDGRSTWVINQGDGKYQVVGGNLNDNDRNIYVGSFNKDCVFVPTSSIGITTSITSFYNSDSKGGGSWSVGSVIDMNDRSGDNFLTKIISDNPPMIDDYMLNARNNHPYDFKVTNGTNHPISGIDKYRGMPIGVNGNGQKIITSARDIGNIAAGYVAGINGMTWEAARVAFDSYQLGVEGISTRNAERYGWRMGYSNANNSQKRDNLIRSLGSALSSFWNYITK